MASPTKKGLPILLKRAEVSLPLQRVQVQVTVVKTRELHLLEWAVLAPLANLNPPPPLEEIVQELGIELVDFLKVIAEQLKSTGLVQQIGVNRYQITDIGKKFYSEGKVISDPRHIQVPIYYLADTKEWIQGFAGDIDRKALEENTSRWDLREPDPDIGLPEKIITNHMRERRDIEENETIAEYTLKSIISDPIKFSANFLLKSDGIAIRPVEHPFGEENAQKISVALSRIILGSSQIRQYLSEFYDIAGDVSPTKKVRPHELADAVLFTPGSEDQLVEYLTAQKPRYLVINRHLSIPEFRATTPFVLMTGMSAPTRGSATSPFHAPIHFRVEGMFPDYAYLTDAYAVRVVNVVDDHADVPLFMVEENRMQNETASTLCKQIAHLDISGPRKLFERDLALFYILPSAESLNQVFLSLRSLKSDILEFAAYDKEELLQNVLALRKLVPGSLPDSIEKNFVAELLRTLPHNKLLEIDPEILIVYFTEYIDAVKDALTLLSLKTDLHQLLLSYPGITGRLKEHEKIHGDEIQQFKSSYLTIIARAFDQTPEGCSLEDLKSGMKLFSEVSSTDSKEELGRSLLSAVIATKLKRGEKIPVLLQLAEMGVTSPLEYVERVGKEMLHELTFDWFDPDLHKKVQAIIKLCQTLNPSADVGRELEILELSGCPKNKREITSLVNNLFALSQSGTSVDCRIISEVLQQASHALRNGEDPDKLVLWIALLAAVRPFEEENGLRFIPVEDAEVIETLRPLDPGLLYTMRDTLASLSFSSLLPEKKEEDAGNGLDRRPLPPINRVVIDGSNVAHYGQEKNTASADQVMQAYNDLKDLGFEKVYIFTGAGLRHAIGKDTYKEMERYFRRIGKKTKTEIFHQAPAGTDDDQFIINFAIKSDLLILTNDLYRDAIQKNPELEGQIKGRLIKFMFNPESKALMITNYPDYSQIARKTEES
jgi:hypothetical protein